MTPGNAITIRPALRRDAADLAIIDNMASHGMSMQFWEHAVANGQSGDPLSHGRNRFADPQNIFGWTNAVVAEIDGMIVGAATAYVMPPSEPEDTKEAEEFKRSFPGFVPVFELFALAEGHWFLDSIGVYEHMRGQGIAGSLTDRCIARGKELGCPKVSLVVEDANRAALSLYENRGFVTRDSRPYVGGPDTGGPDTGGPDTGGPDTGNENDRATQNWLLMVLEDAD